MSKNIIPINIPCITKFKVGLDADSGQLYYTSGINDYKSITVNPDVISGTIAEKLADYIPISGLTTTNDSISLINNEVSLDKITLNSYEDHSNIAIGNDEEFTEYSKTGIYSKNNDSEFSISSYFDSESNSNILNINVDGSGENSYIKLNNNNLAVLNEEGKLPNSTIPTDIARQQYVNEQIEDTKQWVEQQQYLTDETLFKAQSGQFLHKNQPNAVSDEFNIKYTEIIKDENDEIKETNINKNGIYIVNQTNLYDNTYTLSTNNMSLTINGINLSYYHNGDGTKSINYGLDNIQILYTNVDGETIKCEANYGLDQFCIQNNINNKSISYNSNDGLLKLNGQAQNTPEGLVTLNQNGFIIDDQLLKAIELDISDSPTIDNKCEVTYEISGGMYATFTNNPLIYSLKLTTPYDNGDGNYTNKNKYGYLRFICGVDNMQIEFPDNASILNSIPVFKENKKYLIKFINNQFEIFESVLLRISDDYIIGPGITLICRSGERFSNVTVQDHGTLIFETPDAILNNLNVESGGKLVYTQHVGSDTTPTNYSLLQGRNTNIASGTIFIDDQPINGYCENGIFYDLTSYYKLSIGNNIIADEPIVGDASELYCGNGGIISGGTINEEGKIYVYNNGIALNIFNFNGYMCVSGGGIASNTTHEAATIEIYNNGVASDTIIDIGGNMNIYSGGITINTNIIMVGEMCIFNGGNALNTTINNNGYISNSGTATSTIINDEGIMEIYNGGNALNTTINNNGSMNISSGGNALSTTVNDEGIMEIYNGGNATSTTISNGGINISNGGIASNTNIRFGNMYISSGGTALAFKNNMRKCIRFKWRYYF